ncbi:YdcF family protein [Amorphus sp. 3PC139-8]|uniref:YdcF family protein n=1 Tax=Amorphus sp. 3PC139-8 TaxID=2735676 RepID=UPI00345DC1EC
MMNDVGQISAGPADVIESRRHGSAATVPRFVVFAVGCLAAFLVAGFLWFADQVAAAKAPLDPHADGIVVLTGGAMRINGAVALLEEGRAQRLLITGVNPETTESQIASAISAGRDIFDCCIDIDRKALDTIENARQTREWAAANDFKRLIVVTSAYHMPRTLAELKREVPDRELVPFPVFHEELELNHWYRDRAALHVVLREYVKYALARLRLSLEENEPGRELVRIAQLRRDF